MKELTKAEEQVMQNLWKLGKGFVKDVVELFEDPKPAYNTVSTIIRILEKKEFVSYKAYGNTYEYFPVVSKEEYTQRTMKKFVGNYFGNSYKNLFSFFSKNENLSLKELEELKQVIEKEINQKKK
jgi:BlaI family transcriptional regulator, penicillinase repressor